MHMHMHRKAGQGEAVLCPSTSGTDTITRTTASANVPACAFRHADVATNITMEQQRITNSIKDDYTNKQNEAQTDQPV